MAFDLRDRFETSDGSRPDGRPLESAVGKRLPLSAFAVLKGGDAFEAGGGKPPADAAARARAYVEAKIEVRRNGCGKPLVERVRADVSRQLEGNPVLVERLLAQKPIVVDLVPEGDSMGRYGFPPQVYEHAAGLFWDKPSWSEARIALREEHLPADPALVVHEMAHAIQALAWTAEENALVYQVLRPTFGSRAAMDEVFAVYSEREFLPSFTDDDKRAPGVYGYTRRQWNEDHLFTRFVRKLYFPHKPLAGPKLGGPRNAWAKFASGR